MKVLITALLTAAISFGAIAADTDSPTGDNSFSMFAPALTEPEEFLNEENAAKHAAGEVVEIRLVKKSAPVRERPAQSSEFGTLQQALIQDFSCSALLYVDFINYKSTGGGCGISEPVVDYADSVNVNVEIDYETRTFDWTEVGVRLYAEDLYSNEVILLDSAYYSVQSDTFGSGANTVIFVIDYDYNLENGYRIFAEVDLDDELGRACELETNNDVVVE